MTPRRARAWSTSCSSTSSSSSIASIYPAISQSSPLARPTEGHTNVYGSFTTTVPATLWLRARLALHIPLPGTRRAKRRDIDCSFDSPPDSPLSFFRSLSGSSRSPSISRTLLTDFDSGGPSTGSDTFSTLFPLPSSSAKDDSHLKLHPVLRAVEHRSRFSCRSTCSACGKAGSNFPRCPRCNEMWCSRTCRLQGAKKHTCARHKT